MKTAQILAIGSAALFAATQVNAATITVTAAQVSDAATNPDTGDLGDTSITIGDFTIASTGISPDNRNLGWGTFASDTVESIGVVGGDSSRDSTVAYGEELTLSFTDAVNVTSMVITDHGRNDGTAIINGFSSDPGASVSGLLTGWTVTYSLGAVSIATNDNSGYLSSYVVTFANLVDVTELTITTPELLNDGPGGVGFGAITFVPEPGSLALMGLGGLLMLKRRRRA